MKRFAKTVIILMATALMSSPAFAVNFSDDFESYNLPDNNPIGGGWLWYLSGWNDWPDCNADYWFGYGPNPAPNSNNPYTASNIAVGATGQALNVFSDYANQDVQASDKCAEVSVFQETVVTTNDIGQYNFRFEVQANETLGEGVRTNAFIKMLDPNQGYATVYYDWSDTASSGAQIIQMNIGPNDVGKILQFGFANVSNENKVSSRVYDNVTFAIRGSGAFEGDAIGVPIPFWATLAIAVLLSVFGAAKLRSRKSA
jgi:hypothetical protein